jgi:hypothetical protein
VALDGARVLANSGSLLYDTGDANTRIGFRGDMVQFVWRPDMPGVFPEDFGSIPLDYLNLGGPVFVMITAWQFDVETRRALGKHMITGIDFEIGTADVGRLMSSLTSGSLTFTPDAGSKHVGFTAAHAVPVREEELRVAFGPREISEYLISFACLPPAAGGLQIKLTETP